MNIMEIPKTMSAVANPGEPSFLTSIPPEIRNSIYEILFKRDDPVLLHNAEAYHPVKPERKKNDPRNEYASKISSFYDEYEQGTGADDAFEHGFQESISLLRSCRQVYHEAVGILYSSNSFVISRAHNRHDGFENNYHDRECNVVRNSEDYFQIVYAPRWLSALGSQFSFLRKVVIDVDTMCPTDCVYCMQTVDVLPLIQLMWNFPKARDVVTFGHSGRALTFHEVDEAYNVNIAMTFNNIFTSLAVEDMLNIKRYSYSKRLLKSVIVGWDHGGYKDGYVLFGNANEESENVMNFAILDDGRVIKPEMKQQDQQQLIGLPKEILERIFGYTCLNNDRITFDLDTKIMKGLDRRPFRVHRQLWAGISSTYLISRSNDIVFKMRSTAPSTDFDRFRSWQEVSQLSRRVNIAHNLLHMKNETCNPLTLSLEFDLPTPMTLSDIRINIWGLMLSFEDTKVYHISGPGHNVALHFKLNYPQSSGTWTEETTVALQKMQKGLFLLLSDIMNEYGDIPLPEIWIDGRGNILYAKFPEHSEGSTARYAFRHSKLSRAELCQRGYFMAKTLEEKYEEDIDIVRQRWKAGNSLQGVWYVLRSLHWPDWKEYCGNTY